MNDTQKKFLELSKQMEALNAQRKELKPQLEALMVELGVGSHFQDPDTGLVYQIEVPNGTFIEYKRIGYARTKAKEEVKGTLSMKKAEDLGYKVK